MWRVPVLVLLDQATGDAFAVKEVLNKSATCPVEGTGPGVVIQQNATQPVEVLAQGRPPNLLRFPERVPMLCFPVPVVQSESDHTRFLNSIVFPLQSTIHLPVPESSQLGSSLSSCR